MVGASAQPGSIVALAPVKSPSFKDDVTRAQRDAGNGELIWTTSGATLDPLLEPSDFALYSSMLQRLRIVRAPIDSNTTSYEGHRHHSA